ncbi:MAG: hypothetical protein ACYTXT_03330 [Nostoc sp.]
MLIFISLFSGDVKVKNIYKFDLIAEKYFFIPKDRDAENANRVKIYFHKRFRIAIFCKGIANIPGD